MKVYQQIEAFRKTLHLYSWFLCDCSYSIKKKQNTIYVAKNKSPLLVGVGEGFNVVASDAMAMLQVTNQFIELHDQEIVLVHKDTVEIQKLDGTIS